MLRWRSLRVCGVRLAAVLLVAGLGGDPVSGLDPGSEVYQYSLRSWSLEDGLPQKTIGAITQTPDGYIWLGTRGGLVRSDGVRFKVFDRSNTEAMASSIVNDLAVDAEGTLWIATNDGLLSYSEGRFRRWDDQLDNSTRRVLRVLAGRFGDIYFGSYGGAGRLRDGRAAAPHGEKGARARAQGRGRFGRGAGAVGPAADLLRLQAGARR